MIGSRRIVVVCSLLFLAAFPVDAQTDAELPGLELASVQSSPACPGNICPGLGNAFYLPDINATTFQTGGRVFFNERRLGDCVLRSNTAPSQRRFVASHSMERLISHVMSSASLSGSYRTKVLSMRGTTEAMSGVSSDVTTTFNSTHMDISAATHVVDFQQDSRCFADGNIDRAFLRQFESLPPMDGDDVSNGARWHPYVEFLKTNGSHVLMQQLIGSRFQQWESSTSTASNTARMLQIKACAEVEGKQTGGGWSVGACGAYSSEQKLEALAMEAKSERLILGSSATARAALLSKVDEANLNTFIRDAAEGDQAIQFKYRPVWDLLRTIYEPACEESPGNAAACANLQRAVTLQAAFEGWTAVGCQRLVTGNNVVYQQMRISAPDAHGIHTYQCTVERTGCRNDGDCRLGGLLGGACYCYGPSCLDRGEAISGTTMVRTTVRGSQSGGYRDGVNNSCNYRAGAVRCGCNSTWSGGLATRTIYDQSVPALGAAVAAGED